MKVSEILYYYFTILFTSFIMLKTYETFSTKKLKLNKKNIFTILFFSLICFFNNLFMLMPLRIFTSTILLFLIFKIIYKEKNSKTLFYTLFISIALILSDLLISIGLPKNIENLQQLNNSIIFKIGLSILSSLVSYGLIANRWIKSFLIELYTSGLNKKHYNFLGIIIIFVFNIWMIISCVATSNKLLNITIFICEILSIYLISIIIKDKYNTYILKTKEEQLKQNLELYTKVAGEYKELKHNLMNDLLIIKTKLAKKEQKFINDIIQKYKSNYEWVNAITDIPEGLQGLVFLKKHQAELKKIHFNFETNINTNININNNFRLYEALGIIFDNAIEGAAESKEKIINIIFSEEKNKITIKVMNTFNNSIDLDKIGDKDYSTKNRGSGIGLNYLKKQKNKFKIHQSIRENIFITEIIINRTEKTKRKK